MNYLRKAWFFLLFLSLVSCGGGGSGSASAPVDSGSGGSTGPVSPGNEDVIKIDPQDLSYRAIQDGDEYVYEVTLTEREYDSGGRLVAEVTSIDTVQVRYELTNVPPVEDDISAFADRDVFLERISVSDGEEQNSFVYLIDGIPHKISTTESVLGEPTEVVYFNTTETGLKDYYGQAMFPFFSATTEVYTDQVSAYKQSNLGAECPYSVMLTEGNRTSEGTSQIDTQLGRVEVAEIRIAAYYNLLDPDACPFDGKLAYWDGYEFWKVHPKIGRLRYEGNTRIFDDASASRESRRTEYSAELISVNFDIP